MNLKNRYVLREILGPTTVAFAIYTGFMLIRGLVSFSDLLLQSSRPLRDVGLVIAFSAPHIVVLTLPVAFLLGILVGIGRLSQDSELVALRAAGVDLFSLYRPIVVLAVVFTVVTGIVMTVLLPRTNRILQGMRLQLSTYAIAQRIQPGIFSPEFAGRRIYVETASSDRRTLEGLILADRSNPSDGERLTLARRGALELEEAEGRLWLRLDDAVSHHTDADARGYDRTSYRTQRVLLDDTDPKERFAKTRPDKQLREMTLGELVNRARTSTNTGLARLSWVEVHKKFSFPAACLVFGLVGLPLGVVNRRGGRAAGFAVSTAIVLGYYILYASGETRAIKGQVPPWLAMWLPNLLLVGLGLWAMRKVRRDRTLFEGSFSGPFRRLAGRVLRRFASDPAASAPATDDGARVERPHVARAWLVDRYVLTRFAQVFVLVLASVLVLYVLIEYLDISNDIARVRPPWNAVVGYFQAKLAPILVDIVPLAFATAALIAVAGLVRSSESTALLANGISLFRTVASILVCAALAGISLFLFAERVVPRSASEAERLRNVLLGKPPATVADAWRSYLRGEAGRFFSAETWDPQASTVTGVTVLEVDLGSFRLVRKSYGARGRLLPGKGILLEDGWTRSFGPDSGSLFLKRAGTSFVEAPEAARTFIAGRADPRQMSSLELSRFVRLRRQAGADVSAVSTGLFQKSSVVLAPLLLTLVGLPFAFRFGKRGAVAGIGIALLLGLAYLVVGAALVKAGETGTLPPLLAAWGTNLFFSLGAAWGLLGIRS